MTKCRRMTHVQTRQTVLSHDALQHTNTHEMISFLIFFSYFLLLLVFFLSSMVCIHYIVLLCCCTCLPPTKEEEYVFTPVARCLSVRLSVHHIPVLCGIVSKRLYISSKFFSPSGSPTTLIHTKRDGMAIFRREPPLTGASNAKVYEKSRFFDQYIALSRK